MKTDDFSTLEIRALQFLTYVFLCFSNAGISASCYSVFKVIMLLISALLTWMSLGISAGHLNHLNEGGVEEVLHRPHPPLQPFLVPVTVLSFLH